MTLGPRLLRLPEVEMKVGLRRNAIYERQAAGTFPKSISLGGKSVAWLEEEVNQWIADRVSERDNNKNNQA